MICVNHLTKKYGSHTAIEDLSFSIEEGKIYGLLGPNGAGKSTTMNIITGCLAASAGTVTVDGIDHFEDSRAAKRLIGYLPEMPPLYGDLTPYEYLCFVARAKGLKGEALEADVREIMDKTRITEMSGRLIRNLSKGYRQRVGIAQAMLGNPKYIILDEPTVGLDPLQIIEIRTLIRELSGSHTVILSSHILAEVQEVCDQLLIIADGKIAAAGTIEQIIDREGGDGTLSVIAKDEGDLSEVFDGIQGIERVQPTDADEGLLGFTVFFRRGSDIREAVYRSFVSHGGVLLDLHANVPTLESVFLHLTERSEEISPEEPVSPAADAKDDGDENQEDGGYTPQFR